MGEENIITLTFFLVLIAGVINGSFASPIKFIHNWREENSWFIYGIWAFLLFPILTILLLQPEAFLAFNYLNDVQIAIVLFGGIAFGVGQIFLTVAFRYIGIGVSFIINIGIGTILTTVFSLYFSPENFVGSYYYFRIIAAVMLLIAIVIAFLCMDCKNKLNNPKEKRFAEIFTGTVCAALAGLGSGAQGLAFVYINPILGTIAKRHFSVNALTADILTWVLIFCFAAIPFILYFLYKIICNGSFHCYRTKQSGKYLFYTFCMGLCFWLSLAFLARGNSMIISSSESYQTSLWAIFMVFIIITSTTWSFKLNEWNDIPYSLRLLVWVSVITFIVSIVIIALSINISVNVSAVFGQL